MFCPIVAFVRIIQMASRQFFSGGNAAPSTRSLRAFHLRFPPCCLKFPEPTRGGQEEKTFNVEKNSAGKKHVESREVQNKLWPF